MTADRSLSPSHDHESGYNSATPTEQSTDGLPQVYFTPPHLAYINKQLANLEPEDILKWALLTFPNLYQTTAFGLSGLVTLDLLSKISPVPLIFLDTLYHFPETLSLVSRIQERYPNTPLHVYRPADAETAEEFEQKHGEDLWEKDDTLYDYLAKVEPAERAYRDLKVTAVLTGRRRSQGAKRSELQIVEIDDKGMVKINPMANWSFPKVKAYITENDVPYNELLDQGYKSVGDWHSTQPVAEGEDERAGRWKGTNKTECGIHNKRSKYAEYLQQQALKKEQEELEVRLQAVAIARDESSYVVEVQC